MPSTESCAGVLATIAYSAAGTLVVLKLLGLVLWLRVDMRSEGVAMDITQHGEEAPRERRGPRHASQGIVPPGRSIALHHPQALRDTFISA